MMKVYVCLQLEEPPVKAFNSEDKAKDWVASKGGWSNYYYYEELELE